MLSDVLKRAIEAYIQASYAALAGYIERLLTEHADVRHPLVRYRLFDDAGTACALARGQHGGLPRAVQATLS